MSEASLHVPIGKDEPVRQFDENKPFKTRDGRSVRDFRNRACTWHTFFFSGKVDGRCEWWMPNGVWAPWRTDHPLDLINVASTTASHMHQGWNPISTAPLDGTYIIGARWDLYWRDVGKYAFDSRFSQKWLEDEHGFEVALTHWRSLIPCTKERL